MRKLRPYLLLLALGACGNPFGKSSDIAKEFQPGLPAVTPTPSPPDVEDPNRPKLLAGTTSFTASGQVIQEGTDPNRPTIRHVAIFAHDVDRRGPPHTPDAVTLAADSSAALTPDPASACGTTCHAKKMYLGFLSLFTGE